MATSENGLSFTLDSKDHVTYFSVSYAGFLCPVCMLNCFQLKTRIVFYVGYSLKKYCDLV